MMYDPAWRSSKRCSRCGFDKNVADFYSSDAYCKSCRVEQANEARKRNPERYKFLARIRKYGLSEADYAALLAESGGRCMCCREVFIEVPFIEHNHATGKVRGLVCRKCNYAIAVVEDGDRVLFAQEWVKSR